jgi:FdhD protein
MTPEQVQDDTADAAGPSVRAYRELRARRLDTASATAAASEQSCVALESILQVQIADFGSYALMCSPCELRALTAGFLFTEGLITGMQEIAVLEECFDEPGTVRVRLTDPERSRGRPRNLIVVSSCGLCGSAGLKQALQALPRVGRDLATDLPALQHAMASMSTAQTLFRRTGATHAAALFRADGKLLASAEDIGRHNALDKAIGKCLLAGVETAGCGATLSGRVSFEIVSKGAQAGLELLAAVSAPTSLALEAARISGITVCAFVRGTRATVYTRAERLRPRADAVPE